LLQKSFGVTNENFLADVFYARRTALMQAQIDKMLQVGELTRNELDNDRDAWRSQADKLRQLVG
jgi:hypothetical protein